MTYVRGVGGNVSKGTGGGDLNESLFELLGSDLSNSVGGVGGGLQGDVVGQKTSNVGGSHGGSRNGVDSVVAADPGGQNVQTRSKDVSALSVVGEVGTLISQGGGTDSDGVGSSGRRVVASIGVIVTSSDGKVNTSLDSSVNSEIQSTGATATERHVGNAALPALLALLGLLDVSLSSPLNTLDDVGHGARAVGAQDLDSVDIGLLGNTVLGASDGARAVSAVSVTIDILVTLGNGLAPVGTALKVNVVNVGTSVNHVGIDTLTAILGIEVLVEGAKGEAVTVGDTGQTPGGVLLNLGVGVVADLGVLLDVLNLLSDDRVSGKLIMRGRRTKPATYIRMTADLLNDILVEMTRVSHERTSDVESILHTQEGGLEIKVKETTLLQLRPVVAVSGVDVLHPAVVSGSDRGANVLLKHDNIGVWDLLCIAGGEDGGGTIVDGFHPGW